MTRESIRVVGGYLQKSARMLARACAPEDVDAARAFAEALKRPELIVQATETEEVHSGADTDSGAAGGRSGGDCGVVAGDVGCAAAPPAPAA